MDLCLVMIGRIEKREDGYYTDTKNINVIKRYLKYFEKINIVARKSNNNALYTKHKIDLDKDKIEFNLYDGEYSLSNIQGMKEFSKILNSTISSSDLVLCWAEPKTSYIVKTAHKLNKKCLVYVGSCIKDTLLSHKSLKRKIAAYLLYFSTKKGIYNADYVHYVTNEVLQERYPTSGKSIGASYVDIDLNISQVKRRQRFQRYNNMNRTIVIGLVGYLNEVKGIDTALQALSDLNNSNVVLRILGGGDKEYYENMTKKLKVDSKVYFDGTLEPGKEVLDWLDKIDIYIQPSRTEGLPRATIEAMSRGCPVISSNAMGLRELIPKKWRHSKGNSQELAYLLNEIIHEPVKLKKLSKYSFDRSMSYERNELDRKIDDFFMAIMTEIGEKK